MLTRLGKVLIVTGFLLMPQTLVADVAGKIRVIDGDTLDVEGTRVRLFGIDAPEAGQSCTSANGAEWQCGAWVTSVVRARFEGRQTRCDTKDTDRYGRTVARCFVGERDISQVLVQEGLAFAYRRYSMDYDFDEKGAAIRGVGVHAGEIQSPAAFRRGDPQEEQAYAPGCAIKGNISAKGARIYHSPGQRDYNKTRISKTKGERWFCSVAEAEAAGWRAARR